MLRTNDIQGLTPTQIQQKYSLPNTPTHIVDVNIPSNIPMQSGQTATGAFGGSGGGLQYNILTDTKSSWFTNPRPINK